MSVIIDIWQKEQHLTMELIRHYLKIVLEEKDTLEKEDLTKEKISFLFAILKGMIEAHLLKDENIMLDFAKTFLSRGALKDIAIDYENEKLNSR